jgi:hypothetical protein
MTSSWWEDMAQMLDEAAEYLADDERSSAGYLSRAAWMGVPLARRKPPPSSGTGTAVRAQS